MDRKAKVLPSIENSKSRGLLRDKQKLEQFLNRNLKERETPSEVPETGTQDYRKNPIYAQLRANNFVSRIDPIDNPSLIFTIADQVRHTVRDKNAKQNSQWQRSSIFNRSYVSSLGDNRGQMIQLAKWLDEKLQVLKQKKEITFLDLLDYKQTVLNFSLGKIIDSVSKRCREEGQILSLIWNNTFKMLQSVFQVLVGAVQKKEKEKTNQRQQMQKLFETNHNFLRQENGDVIRQNKMIFQKMKQVILWNKRLRKQRKKLFTQNRVLQYRNYTYFQGLQSTLTMLLQNTPQAYMIPNAKKILMKMGRQKKNHRKHIHKKTVDQEVHQEAKTVVFRWFRTNGYLQQIDTLQSQLHKKEDQQFCVSQNKKDIEQMEKIDIYDFFKTFEQGVQAVPKISHVPVQCFKPTFVSSEAMTNNNQCAEKGCQTANVKQVRLTTDDFSEAQRSQSKKQVEMLSQSLNSANKALNGKQKTIGKINKPALKNNNTNFGNLSNSKMMKVEKQQQIQIVKKRKEPKGRGMTSFIIQNGQFPQMQQIKSKGNLSHKLIDGQKDQDEQSSMNSLLESRAMTKGHLSSTRRILTNHFIDYGRESEFNSFNKDDNQKTEISLGFRRKVQKQRSVAFIPHDNILKKSLKLEKKNFQESYRQNKIAMEQNKQDFCDRIIRRRSFFTKGRIQLGSLGAAEDGCMNRKQFLRAGHYLKNYEKLFAYKTDYINTSVDKLVKKCGTSSNMCKTKALTSNRNAMMSIINYLQHIPRQPPKSKAFISSSIATLAKYISDLVGDHVKQIRRQKDGVAGQQQKVLYPLGILVLERMTCKYGLKDIAQKKIKHFLEKILTFASVNEKAGLYALLLGLEDESIGTDELLLYLRCLVYFDSKGVKQAQSVALDIQLVRENIEPAFGYFFDKSFLSMLQLKLQIYFQNNVTVTAQGIAILVIRQMLKYKKQLHEKYQKMHQLCSQNDNFFTNLFKMLKMVQGFSSSLMIAEKKSRPTGQRVQKLRDIKGRNKKQVKLELKTFDLLTIAQVLKELVARSDIIDQQYGKSITLQKFLLAAEVLHMPTKQHIERVINFIKQKLQQGIKNEIQGENNVLSQDYVVGKYDNKSLQMLGRRWRTNIPRSDNIEINMWSVAQVIWKKIDDQTLAIMGKVGQIGLFVQQSLFSLSTQ